MADRGEDETVGGRASGGVGSIVFSNLDGNPSTGNPPRASPFDRSLRSPPFTPPVWPYLNSSARGARTRKRSERTRAYRASTRSPRTTLVPAYIPGDGGSVSGLPEDILVAIAAATPRRTTTLHTMLRHTAPRYIASRPRASSLVNLDGILPRVLLSTYFCLSRLLCLSISLSSRVPLPSSLPPARYRSLHVGSCGRSCD